MWRGLGRGWVSLGWGSRVGLGEAGWVESEMVRQCRWVKSVIDCVNLT